MAILAQYSIRSKQAYIFRTNAMREITGASALIRDAWDLLFTEAMGAGFEVKKLPSGDEPFPDNPDEAFENKYAIVDLFRGGGNDTVLIRDMEALRIINATFSSALLRRCPGMLPMCAWVETDPDNPDYIEDYRRLMRESEREKNRMRMGRDLAMAPFSMLDRKTFQPITAVKKEVRLSSESRAKLEKASRDTRINASNAWLDNISDSEGSKRLLAIVHADGNNMGLKIQSLLNGKKSYGECVRLMRSFTRETAEAFTIKAKKALDDYAAGMSAQRGADQADEYIVRWIINDGDDATFVCNAKHALELTAVYLNAVSKQSWQPAGGEVFRYSSCAGICICHSHYPFSMAYTMAESACTGAKQKVHSADGTSGREEAWVDWVLLRSGIQTDVEDFRRSQGTANIVARPWSVAGGEDPLHSVSALDKLAETMVQDLGITRSNIKAVGAALEDSMEEGRRELHRLRWRAPEFEKKLKDYPDEESLLRAIYDLAEIYDIWYAERFKPVKADSQ